MMKKLPHILAVILLTTAWFGCKKEGRVDHLDSSAAAPAQISGVKISETPGGAVVTYKIPRDPNLSYVKAVYEIRPDVFREAKASYYTDTLKLVGFGDTLHHEVKIYSVGKNEKESEPIQIDVQPIAPPVRTVFNTVKLTATFGGVNVKFKNASQADLSIVVIMDTTGLGTWAPVTTFYTAAPEGGFSARGYDTTQRKFALFVRDRWGNRSDTLTELLTPLYEQFIDPGSFKGLFLDGDTYQVIEPNVFAFEKLWDGIYFAGYAGCFASAANSVIPQWFTIDFGKKVQLSRMKEFQQQSDHLYNAGAVKSFEIWGSNDPDQDGGWTHWELLGKFQSFKPSGLPRGQATAEDLNYAAVNGEDFDFDNSPPPVRYIRFKTLETYSTNNIVVIAELKFWGKVVK
jgi:hypothetical protein